MIKVTTFYKFFSVPKKNLESIKDTLIKEGENIKGILLIGTEGINATISGSIKSLELYKETLQKLFPQQSFFYKNSFTEKLSFKRFSVKIKKEIISIGRPQSQLKNTNHLNPSEWDAKIKDQAQVLDVRNNYEVALGKFKNADDLSLNVFSEFSKKLDEASLDKDKATLIYCTGGIRCEKASLIMKEKGFKDVYQLGGGVLHYLKEKPCSHFEGECFVFDHRTALNQNLKPSQQYVLCPHCGQPGDVKIKCQYCEKPSTVCQGCLDKSFYNKTCSKNCIYHLKSNHKCNKKYKKNELR